MAIENPFKGMPKWGIYTSIAGGAVIGGYALYSHHKSTGSWSPFASSASNTTATQNANTGNTATTGSTVTDPTTGSVYQDTAIDSQTGITYASEISQYGSVAAAESNVTDFGTGAGAQTYDTGYISQTAVDQTTTTSGQNVYTSNSAWAQAVQAGLESISGTPQYDGVDIGTTLGKYLQGEPLTTAEAQLVGTARGEYGPPPIGNLQIITVPTLTAPPPASTGVTEGYPAPTGLTVKHTGSGTPAVYTATWNLVPASTATGPSPTSYTVDLTNSNYQQVDEKTVSVPDVAGNKTSTTTVSAPKPGTYILRVWANGTSKYGPKVASTTIKVT
jgi:hypothetical protein